MSITRAESWERQQIPQWKTFYIDYDAIASSIRDVRGHFLADPTRYKFQPKLCFTMGGDHLRTTHKKSEGHGPAVEDRQEVQISISVSIAVGKLPLAAAATADSFALSFQQRSNIGSLDSLPAHLRATQNSGPVLTAYRRNLIVREEAPAEVGSPQPLAAKSTGAKTTLDAIIADPTFAKYNDEQVSAWAKPEMCHGDWYLDYNGLSVAELAAAQAEASSPFGEAAEAAGLFLDEAEEFIAFLVRLQEWIDQIAQGFAKEIQKARLFHRRQCEWIAATTVACLDAAKDCENLKPRERMLTLQQIQETYVALSMLEQFCDHNANVLTHLVNDFQEAFGSQMLGATEVFREIAFYRVSSMESSTLHRLKMEMVEGVRLNYTESKTADEARRLLRSRASTSNQKQDRVTLALRTTALIAATVAIVVAAAVEYYSMPQPFGTSRTSIRVKNNDYAWYYFTILWFPLQMTLQFSVMVCIWEFYDVNFAYLFDLDPGAGKWTGWGLLQNSFSYTFAFVVCVYAYVRSCVAELRSQSCASGLDETNPKLPSFAWPYICACVLLAIFVVKHTILHPSETRRWLLPTLSRVLRTPWFPVSFSDNVLALVFISLGSALGQIQWIWCTFHTKDVTEEHCTTGQRQRIFALAAVPILWRMAQCVRKYLQPLPEKRTVFPHMVNFGKYLVGLGANYSAMGVAASAYHKDPDPNQTAALVFFFVLHAANQIYRSNWDVWVDYGLGPDSGHRHTYGDDDKDSPEQTGCCWRLRPRLYPRPIYVCFLILNLLIRCVWIIAYFVRTAFRGSEWLTIVFGCTSVLRRFISLTVRVEHEQVSNIELFKLRRSAPPPGALEIDSAFLGKSPEPGSMPLLQNTVWNDATGRLVGSHTFAEEYHNTTPIYLANPSQVDRFYALLPRREKLRIIQIAAETMPSDQRPKFHGAPNEGKVMWFGSLPEELKVLLLLQRMGRRTVAKYAEDMSHPDLARMGSQIFEPSESLAGSTPRQSRMGCPSGNSASRQTCRTPDPQADSNDNDHN